jgi:hypothetical protein
MTVGQDVCQVIWAYHLPPSAVPDIWKFNTGPTTGPQLHSVSIRCLNSEIYMSPYLHNYDKLEARHFFQVSLTAPS